MRKIYFLLACFLTLQHIAIAKSPDAGNFTFSVDASSNVIFINTSILGNEPGDRKAYWSFGDGTVAITGVLQGTQHHYSTAGTFTVCLKIYRYRSNLNDSVLSAEVCKSITIQSFCEADFERLTGATLNNPIRTEFRAKFFNNTNKKPAKICWTFGDGKDTCIYYKEDYTGAYTVAHTYNHDGQYEVCVKIYYYGGCEAKKCHMISVIHPESCRAEIITQPVTAVSNSLRTEFKAVPWNSNNKKPAKVCWTFGDGKDTCIYYKEDYTGAYTVAHTYNHDGQYEVCVKIYYYGGCEAKKCQVISVIHPDGCSAEIIHQPVATVNNLVRTEFKVVPWHSNNKKPAKICWTFGDGRDTCIYYPENYTGTYSVGHNYTNSGRYEVCVRINYYGGCETKKCLLIEIIRPDICSADFIRQQGVTVNNLFRTEFKALPWHSNNKKPAKICWIFGDGRDTCIYYPENYTGTYTVAHGYMNSGQYEVCIRINYYGGCEAKKCLLISIIRPEYCSAGFIRQTGASVNNPLRTEFTALTGHSNNKKPSKICWTFGDNRDTCINYTENYTGAYSVAHTYIHNGKYEACVRINYFGGCEAKKCQVIEITRPDSCSAGFIRQPAAAITNRLRIELKALPWHNNNKKPSKICWTFGDGQDACISYTETYSGVYTVAHTYANAGEYEVCEKITYYGGCEKRVCKKIRVPDHHEPHLILTPNPVHDKVHALYFSPVAGTVNISILSTNAQVRSYTRIAVAGINNWDFELGILPPGIYTLVVQSANQTVKVMFIKI